MSGFQLIIVVQFKTERITTVCLFYLMVTLKRFPHIAYKDVVATLPFGFSCGFLSKYSRSGGLTVDLT